MANTIQLKRGTSAPDSNTASVVSQPLFHYNTDGSVANLYMGYDTGDNKAIRVGAIVDTRCS